MAREIPGVANATIEGRDAERFAISQENAETILNARLNQLCSSIRAHFSERWTAAEGKPDEIKQITIIVDDQVWNNFDELAASLK